MEVLADHLKQLPHLMNLRLNELRKLDKQSRDASNALIEEENALLTELQACKAISAEEEAKFIERSTALVQKRHDILAKLDTQMKIVQNTYDQIDSKITYMGKGYVSPLHSCYLNADIIRFMYQKYFVFVSTR